ncbi:MAG: glycosyltransferase [Thermoplasmatota archaeon]
MKNDLIVTLADSNYFDQARQVLSSAYHNSGWKGDYMVLAIKMNKGQKEWFEGKGIIVNEIDDISDKDLPHHPTTVLGKFALFGPGMDRWNRIIYLDADTSVTASLDHMLDLKGFWAAVDFHEMKLLGQFKTPGEFGNAQQEGREYDTLRSNYDLTTVTFNSGVMAFDGEMTGEAQYDRLMDLYERYKTITLHDQSTLNLLFYDRWNRLPLAFNNYFLYRRNRRSIRFHKCDGIVNHYILDRIWKTGNKDYFPVWKKYLELSESMDLDRRPGPSETWDEIRIEKVSRELEMSSIRKDTLGGKVLLAATAMDRAFGKVGEMIKARSPRIYKMIRG